MISSRGTIVEAIRNDENLYDGNLVPYLKAVFNAKNIHHPYHNLRHMLHVFYLCYQACIYYRYGDEPSRREVRNLLVAALFHDFDHSGMAGDDDLNIARALRGFRRYIVSEDVPFQAEIERLIQITEYPYTVKSENLPLLAQILRDADLSQVFSVAWIQQVVIGLASEWGKQPIEVLRMQGGFLKGLVFHTEWARIRFSEEVQQKIAETTALLELLETV